MKDGTNMFSRSPMMELVAAKAGEEPSNRPRTACRVATFLVLAIEPLMSREEREKLRKGAALLVNSASPETHGIRLNLLANRAVRKYASEAVAAIGEVAGAATLRDEPDLARAGRMANDMGDRHLRKVPDQLHNAEEARLLAAAGACKEAAKAASLLESEDPYTKAIAAGRTAVAMAQWGRATKNDLATETLALLEELLHGG